MVCYSESCSSSPSWWWCSVSCLAHKQRHPWIWLIVPIGLLLIFLLYMLSRPNYTRLSSRACQLIASRPRIDLPTSSYRQQRYAPLNQYAKCSSASITTLEQRRKAKAHLSSHAVQEHNGNHSQSHLLDSSERNAMSNNASAFDPSDVLVPSVWNELRAPVLANYPDLIDAAEARRVNAELNLARPFLSDDVLTLIKRGFGESDPYPNVNHLGRLWFFLEYNPYLRQLYLTIVKARCLRSINGRQPSTFVRAEILPKLNAAFSTEIIRENANPDYMTETIFNINLSEFAHNVLKLTVHEVDKDVFHTPLGSIYYPLDHLFLAQRAKGHAVWRNLLPEYGDPSAIGLIQIRATVWYDAADECLNIYVHSLRATGVVKQVFRVYVHASVAIHDFPVIPQEHIEHNRPFTHEKCGPIVSLEESNETLYDQLFRFGVHAHEFNDMTVVLDVFRRSLGEEFFDDILLGRTVLVSPTMLAKNVNIEQQMPTELIKEETREIPNPPSKEEKKKQRRRTSKNRKRKKRTT